MVYLMAGRWKFTGFTASGLKWIAICSMVIDHFAVAVFQQSTMYNYTAYRILRDIGRIAFPIYCFLLVEGFFMTSNIKKYITRMFVFSLLSEIPFDMAIHGQIFYLQGQSVFWTLTFGLCTIWVIDKIKGPGIGCLLAQVAVICIQMAFAQVMEVDYHYRGILFIVMFYYCRYMQNWVRNVIGVIAFAYERTAPLAFIPIQLYNGQRGMKLKYFFYLVYPVHLLIFGIIRMYLMI